MRLLITMAAVILAGCASSEYKMYAEAQSQIAAHKAAADQARYAALAQIAAQGDSAAKVAAVMSLNFNSQPQAPQTAIAPPKSTGETLLTWAQLILPTATQFYSIGRQSQVAVTQSNNSAQVAIAQSRDSSNTQSAIVRGFVDVSGKIQGNTTTTTTNTTTNTTTENPALVVTQEKVVIVKPEIVTTEKPVIVNPVVVNPVVIPVPTPASGPGN